LTHIVDYLANLTVMHLPRLAQQRGTPSKTGRRLRNSDKWDFLVENGVIDFYLQQAFSLCYSFVQILWLDLSGLLKAPLVGVVLSYESLHEPFPAIIGYRHV
jgi:hypothetical protein